VSSGPPIAETSWLGMDDPEADTLEANSAVWLGLILAGLNTLLVLGLFVLFG
jgi:hypothetical protein